MTAEDTTAMTEEIMDVDVMMDHVEEVGTDAGEEAMIAVEVIGDVRHETKNY
jgi:hypothetical protein